MKLGRTIFVVFAVAISLTAIWYFRSIFIYIVIAAILSLLGSPLVKRIKGLHIARFKVNSTLAAMIVLVTMGLLFSLLVSLVIPLVVEEAKVISSIKAQDVVKAFDEPIEASKLFLDRLNINEISSSELEVKFRNIIVSFIDVASLSAFANSFIGTLGNLLIGLFSVLFITFFLLKEPQLIPRFLLLLTPEKHIDTVKNIMSRVNKLMLKYLLALLMQSTIVGALLFIGLKIIGVQNALILSFLGAILNLIPYIGPLISGAIGILLVMSMNLHLDFYSELIPMVAKVFIIYSCVQLTDNFILQPFIFSNTVNAHPLEIFIVILLAGTLAGIIGMVIAIPTYSILRIILSEFFSNFKIVKGIQEE